MCTQEVHSLMIDSVVNNTVGPLDSSEILLVVCLVFQPLVGRNTAIEAAPSTTTNKPCAHFCYQIRIKCM